MRLSLIAGLGVLFLSACANPLLELSITPIENLPYAHPGSTKYILTPNAHQTMMDQLPAHASYPTREAGRFRRELEYREFGVESPITLVDGWVISDVPSSSGTSGRRIRLSQASSGKSDELTVYATKYKGNAFLDSLVAGESGSYPRVWDAFVLNSRYFGMHLSDERFVLFDRLEGKFVRQSVEAGVADLVLVDDMGQPYLAEAPENGHRFSLRKIEISGKNFSAPLSPSEVFPESDRETQAQADQKEHQAYDAVSAANLSQAGKHPNEQTGLSLSILCTGYLNLRKHGELHQLDADAQSFVASQGWSRLPVDSMPLEVCDNRHG